MRILFLIISLVLIITTKITAQLCDTIGLKDYGIKFENNLTWPQILEKAKTENKYIFVDFYATWCGPCKMMDKNVYSSENVGTVMKKNFISIKVQMDSTSQDNNYVRNWYADASRLKKLYEIYQLPSYLFFAPDGDLVYVDIGYKSIEDFLMLINTASDPKRRLYLTQFKDYNQGKKKYPDMGNLAIFTKNIIRDEKLATTIARDYKDNYLKKVSKEELSIKEAIDFIEEFPTLINSDDVLFRLCYSEPKKIDKIKGYNGWADFHVIQTINKEEIDSKIVKTGKALTSKPNWNEILHSIQKKYSRVNAKKIVLDYQIKFYRYTMQDWHQWAKYKTKKIRLYPPKTEGLGVYTELNEYGAWDAFLHCNEKDVLTQALDWIDLAIELEKLPTYFDTRANILYKLGKFDEALTMQKKAIDSAKASADTATEQKTRTNFLDSYHIFSKVLIKMKRGEPTYLEEGAIWNGDTLPSKK